MSISSHLTPEPERRLWTLLENMQQRVESTDQRIAALTAFAAAELFCLRSLAPSGPLILLGQLPLCATLPLGVLAFSPWVGLRRGPARFDAAKGKASVDHCLIAAEDLARYAHGELVHRLDKYLGGGVTATPYHEDLVGQVLVRARLAVRKQSFFSALCLLVGMAQVGVAARLLWR